MKFLLSVCTLIFLAACSAKPTATPTILPLPTPTDIPQTLIEAAAEFCPPPNNWIIYVTQPGDTLRSLAERTSSSIDELKLANCLQNPRSLLSGVVFYLPRRPIYP